MGIVVKKHSKFNFRLVQEDWTPVRKETTIPRESYPALGFDWNMTIDQARARASQLNLQNQLESRKIVSIAKRLDDDKKTQSAYLPSQLVQGFELELQETYQDNPSRFKNLIKQWWVVKKMITELSLDPKHFYDERIRIFNYYKNKKWAPDYIKKLTRMANLWGHYTSRINNSHFQPIPKLSSTQVNKIIDLREEVEGLKKAADPLDWNHLKSARETFKNENLEFQWNWLFIGLWFGLRPLEIDNLKKSQMWRVELDPINKVRVLMVYQTKLTSVGKDKRWKPIPIHFAEQKEALKLIEDGLFKRPLNKTLRRLLSEAGDIQTYSPRKGFTDLMLSRGFALEDISVFLGHADISMTWKHYKNKMKFKLPG